MHFPGRLVQFNPPPHSPPPPSSLNQVEKVRELGRLEAWEKEQARRAAREENALNRRENDRLIAKKAAERKASEGETVIFFFAEWVGV